MAKYFFPTKTIEMKLASVGDTFEFVDAYFLSWYGVQSNIKYKVYCVLMYNNSQQDDILCRVQLELCIIFSSTSLESKSAIGSHCRCARAREPEFQGF